MNDPRVAFSDMSTAPPERHRAAKYAAAGALLQKRIIAARTDFAAFIKYVWANGTNFQLADFHLEAISAYSNPALKFCYWEAPRGHAKSLITVAFVVWSLGQDINHRIKILCANDKEAGKRLNEIKLQIERNPLLRLCFPHLKPPTGKNAEWNKSTVLLDRDLIQKDPTIEAMGIMTGALGSRATLIVADDIVDMRNSILQPELKKHVQQKLFGEIIPLLEPEGRFIAVGTPWTLSDANAMMKENPGFYVIGPHKVGNGKDESDPDCDMFEPIWPFKMPREELIRMHTTLGPAEYARAYRCRALTADTVPIQQQWIQYYTAQLIGDPDDHHCLTVYDLAIEQTTKNDYFATVTMLWDKKRSYVFVVDAEMKRCSFRTQAKDVVTTARKWTPNDIVIEHGGYQGSLASYLAEETNHALPIWPFRTRGRSKERRATEASPWFERMRVFFHPKFDPLTNPDINLTCPIIQQIVSFPFDKFDDLIDCVVMGLLVITEQAPHTLEAENDVGFEKGENMQVRLMTIG